VVADETACMSGRDVNGLRTTCSIGSKASHRWQLQTSLP
jgi:hypothetical protein